MNVWEFIQNKLSASMPVMLLYVLDSEGSSPGRKGFKMAVAGDGAFCGTIGGGIMEHKLVEKAKALQQDKNVFVIRQHHDKEHAGNQSGMICSGSQLNAFLPLSLSDKQVIEKIIIGDRMTLQLSPAGIELINSPATGLQFKTEADWVYTEAVNQQPVIHIIGGGHVGLALSELMNFLGFYIKLYDDRPDLNTIAANSFANEKHIVNYENIAAHFNNATGDYVVIMTIGYRTDKMVLKQLTGKTFYYLGLLGSGHKVETLFRELTEEGISRQSLKDIHTPVGIGILSKTGKEIAVSIAAEIIREKNKDMPTGRQNP